MFQSAVVVFIAFMHIMQFVTNLCRCLIVATLMTCMILCCIWWLIGQD